MRKPGRSCGALPTTTTVLLRLPRSKEDAAHGRDLRRALRSMVKTTGLIGRQAGQANSPPACGPAGYLNGVRPGSELCRQVAVDFESDADFHECGSCPVHSCLQFHNNQQPTLGDVWWQEGGGAAF